ncbi:MAG: hypothetical protein A3J46_00115 [Candidatus Yanofskybacteria bacterium RIFCSPHIGHO2_02_FULL_41_11]|uniref:Uncharacterized protein n=1 Tax=Candidatus Yanofskybacteria bacterium RIFCSPHIGHO2_02_FULL_41_11 TaxID=1802675 RepID=A0A1F8F8V4_9BACT|nr:MAG: hypothetical protein A3J46_00115 [Candidatus Yanofskybacteria bacterium RIFCSPHIGHO2_02_FULL_41_11]
MKEKTKHPEKHIPAEIESKDFMSPEKIIKEGRELETEGSMAKAVDLVRNGKAMVEIRKTESGRYKSLSIFRVDKETKNKKEQLVYFDNMHGEIGPLEQQLWKMGIKPIYITESDTETGLKQKSTDFKQDIKQLKSSQETVESWSAEHKEMLAGLILLLKEGMVKLRVRYKKDKNTQDAEIYFVNTGEVWYYTDLSDDISMLTNIALENGYEPEYIEE